MNRHLVIIGILMATIVIQIIVFMVAMGECVEPVDSVDPVEPYSFTDAEAEEIKTLINRDMVANGYLQIRHQHFEVICANLANSDWDWNTVFEMANNFYTADAVGGISFGAFAHLQTYIRLVDATDGEGSEYERSLGAGFCEHV